MVCTERLVPRTSGNFKNPLRQQTCFILGEVSYKRIIGKFYADKNVERFDMAVISNGGHDGRLMVCIGSVPDSTRLVHTAHRMAETLGIPWSAVYVEPPPRFHSKSWHRYQAEEHLRLAKHLGADTMVLSGSDYVSDILSYGRANQVTHILMGRSFIRRSLTGWILGSSLNGLIGHSPDMEIHVLPDHAGHPAASYNAASSFSAVWRSYGFALLVLLACNALAWICSDFLALTNILMIYLIGVLVVVSKCGKGPSTLTCILGVFSFDFFMVPPRFTFAPTDTQYLITLVVLLGVTLAISELIANARHQTEIIRQRENRTAALLALSRKLALIPEVGSLLQLSVEHIAGIFDCRVGILMPDKDGGPLSVQAGQSPHFDLKPLEREAAERAYKSGNPTGRGTGDLPNLHTFYLPFMVSGDPLGVLSVETRDSVRFLDPEQQHLLQALANQIGAFLKNTRLTEESQKAHLQAETEQLRSALLSSVSHDLRTPLAFITGSASSLLDSENHLGENARQELIQGIYSEAERLNRLLSNLLEMTKLAASKVQLKKEIQPLEEIVEVAFSRLDKKLAGRRVQIDFPETLPMLPLDSLLMEQVFINLLENTVKYTPTGTPIEVTARVDGPFLRVEVADEGPGLAKGNEKKIFEKFYQGPLESSKGGVGLGLAICRGVVEAHGGSIWAENRPKGGAVFCFTLPLGLDRVLPDQSKF
jgi:two-component system, OmpR family, sensor histidine kinase KdpD